MTAYYNEIDPFAAQWLRNLIAAKLIASGDVDERSIVDVSPDDIAGYTQAHFFAGIGVWSYALRLAGWPDDRPVWTGSCPCQPFSSAGKGDGTADPRHLWPAWVRLIRECRPHALLGEQVSGVDGLAWLDLVHTDLEACDYAVGAVTLPAASVGAPHGRHRIFFVAVAQRGAAERHGLTVGDTALGPQGTAQERQRLRVDTLDGGDPRGLVSELQPRESRRDMPEAAGGSEVNGLGDADGEREDALGGISAGPRTESARGPCNGFWRAAEWIYCRDGKYRPVEPGVEPLVDGTAFRMGSGNAFEGKSRQGLLRAYGNAIVPQVAAAFVRAYMQTRGLAPQEREGEGR